MKQRIKQLSWYLWWWLVYGNVYNPGLQGICLDKLSVNFTRLGYLILARIWTPASWILGSNGHICYLFVSLITIRFPAMGAPYDCWYDILYPWPRWESLSLAVGFLNAVSDWSRIPGLTSAAAETNFFSRSPASIFRSTAWYRCLGVYFFLEMYTEICGSPRRSNLYRLFLSSSFPLHSSSS